MKITDKLRLIAELMEEGINFEIKSDLEINPKTAIIGLQQLDYCYIEEPIIINDEERFLLKRFAQKYTWIERNINGVIIVKGGRGEIRNMPNVFFDIFRFMNLDEQYVIEDLLNGKVCKIYR